MTFLVAVTPERPQRGRLQRELLAAYKPRTSLPIPLYTIERLCL
jgi:hypothetical protein